MHTLGRGQLSWWLIGSVSGFASQGLAVQNKDALDVTFSSPCHVTKSIIFQTFFEYMCVCVFVCCSSRGPHLTARRRGWCPRAASEDMRLLLNDVINEESCRFCRIERRRGVTRAKFRTMRPLPDFLLAGSFKVLGLSTHATWCLSERTKAVVVDTSGSVFMVA